MIDARGRQLAFNAGSRDQWDGFSDHRRRVSALLSAAEGRAGSRLCVLGAGNGNDLDLPALLSSHREVHLVDLDRSALASAADHQGVADHPGLHLHGAFDVTARLDAIDRWTPHTPIPPADLDALATWPAWRLPLALPGPFDRVASTCLLSQLIDTAYHALGPDHPRLDAVVRSLRAGHLRLLARLAGPRGVSVFITDVASSVHFPPLETADESALFDLLPRLSRERAHLHGLHPSEVVSALRDDAELGPRLSGWESSRPWFWKLHRKRYLVWALTFRVGIGRSW